MLEESYRPYRNPAFLVAKKDRGLRLINLAVKINIVIKYNINLLLNIKEFSKDFIIYIIII